MKNFVRLVFVWLMLVALPFQGIASAAMLACAHGAAQQASVSTHAAMHATTPAAAQTPAPGGHCHDGGSVPDAAAQHHQASLDDGQDHDHDGRCSACAACCMGAAMTPAPAIAAQPRAPVTRLSAGAAGRLAAVDLALPERPPRSPLA